VKHLYAEVLRWPAYFIDSPRAAHLSYGDLLEETRQRADDVD
jgi:hypothetical protein